MKYIAPKGTGSTFFELLYKFYYIFLDSVRLYEVFTILLTVLLKQQSQIAKVLHASKLILGLHYKTFYGRNLRIFIIS
jgi:hypothetical protein